MLKESVSATNVTNSPVSPVIPFYFRRPHSPGSRIRTNPTVMPTSSSYSTLPRSHIPTSSSYATLPRTNIHTSASYSSFTRTYMPSSYSYSTLPRSNIPTSLSYATLPRSKVSSRSAGESDETAPTRPSRLFTESVSVIRDGSYCLSCQPVGLQFSAAMTAKHQLPEIPQLLPGDRDYIGFATLPEQVHRKSVKRGFEFTLMVVGESGLGKSTLVNSLFLNDLYKDRKIPDVSERVEKTTNIEKKTMDIEERGVKLRLTVVDTPGFGDAVNSDDSWRACGAYIDDQFRQYFTDESGLNRKNIQDNRVHCCLYFIPPYGHGLRQIDVEFMKRLHRKVNIVPVIAKADTLTSAEVKRLKERIMTDIEENKIQIYQFPDCDSDEDEEFKQQDQELKASVPFAVVGSNIILEVAGKKVRGRQYPWGVVEVENPKHSDFIKLRTMLISTHMQDLKDVTQDVHYENFRAQCISQISQQAIRERSKLKRDSGPQFDSSITETDRLLLQKDEEIRRMQDMLTQMQEKLKAKGHSSMFRPPLNSANKSENDKRDSVVNV